MKTTQCFWTFPALTLTGQAGSSLNLDSKTILDSSANWETFDTVSLTNASQWYFDLTVPRLWRLVPVP